MHRISPRIFFIAALSGARLARTESRACVQATRAGGSTNPLNGTASLACRSDEPVQVGWEPNSRDASSTAGSDEASASVGSGDVSWPVSWRVVFRLLVALPHSFPSTAKGVRARVSRLTSMSVVAQKARTVGRPPPGGSPQRCHDRPSVCPTAKHFRRRGGIGLPEPVACSFYGVRRRPAPVRGAAR
jgi:hypothetical protein